MDRPLGKKFDPRPKRIQRSEGSYWVANPCVSEHFLNKQLGDIDKQTDQYNAKQSKEQRELHRELQSIKATKPYRKYRNILTNVHNIHHHDHRRKYITCSLYDMIEHVLAWR